MKSQNINEADAGILGQIMAAQSILFVLTSEKQIADFLTKSFSSIPGISSCRICIGDSYSQHGKMRDDLCTECKNYRTIGLKKDFNCRLDEEQNFNVFSLETLEICFGFFIFYINQPALFELYKPFICNLGNLVALTLENRNQKSDLLKAQEILETKVEERTRELQSVNVNLEEEIEERKRIEDALHESEEQFKFLFETMAQGIIVQDVASKILEANDAACEILGLSKDQLLGKTAYDPGWKLIHEDGSPLHPDEMPSNIALRNCKPVTDVLIGAYIPEQDTYHWILTSSTPKFNIGDSKPYLTMTTFTNITERKKAEEALYESQQVFRTLVENSPDIIARYGPDCKRIYVNPVYLRESKISPQELLESTPIQRSPLPTESAVILQNLLRNVFDTGISGSADVLWPKEDNIDHWYNVYASPELDREGKIVSVMTISRDITARKQVEQERLEHLRFFESMDRINRVLQNSNDLTQMMSEVLDIVLSIFNCDRIFLMYPCDPQAATWNVPIERNKPEYPGVHTLGIEMPMNTEVAETLRILLSSNGPVQFGPGTQYPLPADVSEQFGFKCFMSSAIYPKVGKPWQFGIHQCSYARTWTTQEVQLFQEIGRRIADSMSSLLTFQDLQESEQRYRMVFENSPVSIWEEDFSEVKKIFDNLKTEGITNIETYLNQYPETVRQCAALTKILDVNQSSLIVHAAKTKQELMTNLVNTFTPESFDTFRKELVCLWNGGTEMTSDATVKTLSGNLRYVTVYFAVCPGYEETLSKILVSLIDITDRKQAENALIKSEVGLKEAQRLGHLGSWDWDAITDTITWSEEYYRIYGFDPTQRPPGYEEHLSAYTSESAALLNIAVKKNMETGEPYTLDLELARTDGTRRWITARSETKRDQKGNIVGLRGTAQDITESKLAEEEIRKLNQELEKRVIERTSQLELANKELEAFAYSVSHDLRAPLRGIDGFSLVLLEDYHDRIDAQGKDYLQRIRSATQRMAQLIDDLLNLSRISRSGINVRQVDLTKMVREIANNLQNAQPERQIEFVIKEGVSVQADSHLIKIVMENLLGNAWKFTSKHPTARIEFGELQQNGVPVFFVRDNGAGFDMKYSQRLFGAFQRLHTAIEFAGTGIGLATVQRIIRRHGGKIWAEGEVEKGATFYFTITNKMNTISDET